MELISNELKAVTVILRASQSILEVIRKDVAKYGLNTTEFSVLELLHHKGDQPIQAIGKNVLIASSSITYVVDKLEQKNYVERKGCPEDRRVIYASLTSEGKKFMDEIFPQHKLMMTKLFGQIETDDLQKTVAVLKEIGHKAETQ